MKRIAAALLVVLVASPAFAYRERKVSTTAYPDCFKLVLSSDHVSPATGLTISGSECTRSQNGGSFSNCTGAVSEVANGVYCLAGNATDRSTLGPLVIHILDSGATSDANDFEIEVTTNDPFIAPDTSAVQTANATQINGVSTSSVTAVNANIGSTQPVNFTGTSSSALVKSDMVDVAGAAVSASTAQLGVNVVNFGGSAGTFASGRPEVNTTHFGGSAGTFASGRPEVNTARVDGASLASHASGMFPADVLDFGSTAGTFSLGIPSASVSDKTGFSLSAGGVTAVQSGLATSSAVAGVQSDTDDIQTRLPAALTGAGNIKADAQVVSDKTGFSLTQAFPTNFSSFSINGSGQVDAIKIAGTTQTGLDLGGNYTAARALKLDNLDAAVSTRLATSGYTAPLSAGATANALWDELTSGHSASGSFGKLLKDQLDTNVGSRMATSALPTNFSFLSISGGGAVTLTAAYDAAKTAAQVSDIPSSAAVSSAVWSDTLADYSGIIGSTAGALAASAAGANPVSIASAVWNSSATGPSTWTVHNSAGELFALKLALISSGAITVSSPVAANGVDLNIAPGTAYMTTPHSRAATFGPISDVDLTGATVTLTIVSGNATVLSSAGSVVAAGTSEQYVVFQLTALNTALLSRIGTGAYSHQVNATWATDTPTQPIRVLSGKVNTDPKYFE